MDIAPTSLRSADDEEASGGGAPWVRVCALNDIPLRGARVLQTETQGAIALFRSAAQRVFALADRCPHRGGPLSQGMVCADTVVCPLHGWTLDLASGCACAPDEGRARRYAVQLRGEEVWLCLRPEGDA